MLLSCGVLLHISFGNLDSLLNVSIIVINEEILKIPFGIDPVSSLPLKLNFSREEKLPTSSGILPWSKLYPTSKICSLEMLNKE